MCYMNKIVLYCVFCCLEFFVSILVTLPCLVFFFLAAFVTWFSVRSVLFRSLVFYSSLPRMEKLDKAFLLWLDKSLPQLVIPCLVTSCLILILCFCSHLVFSFTSSLLFQPQIPPVNSPLIILCTCCLSLPLSCCPLFQSVFWTFGFLVIFWIVNFVTLWFFNLI